MIEVHSISIEKASAQPTNTLTLPPPYQFSELAVTFEQNGYHQRCITTKAITSAGLGYTIESESESEKKRCEEFIDSQAREYTLNEMFYNIQLDYEIFGNAFIEVVRNAKGVPAELYHIPAVDCTLRADANGMLYLRKGLDTEFAPYSSGLPNTYLHLKNYAPSNPYYGTPEYAGIIASISLDRSAVEYNLNRFRNNAIPESVLYVRGQHLASEQRANIKTFFQENYKGTTNAGRLLILTSEDEKSSFEIKPLGAEQKDAQFRGLREDTRDEIIATHGVPKRLIGIAEAGALGGTSEGMAQMKIFKETLIEPRQRRFEAMMNTVLADAGFDARFALNEFDVDSVRDSADFYSKMITAGVYTPNEARIEIGLPELKENALTPAGALVKGLYELRKQLEGHRDDR